MSQECSEVTKDEDNPEFAQHSNTPLTVFVYSMTHSKSAP